MKDHLGDALETLPPASQAAAAEIFNHLVTPSGTKIAHSVSDLAEYAAAPTAELEPVLQALASERILRPVGGTGESTRYEIYHDVLAQPALTWRAQHRTEREVERKVAEEHRRRRRLQRLFALVLVALGLMVGVTIFALSQRSEARSRGAEARLRADEARAALRQARVAKPKRSPAPSSKSIRSWAFDLHATPSGLPAHASPRSFCGRHWPVLTFAASQDSANRSSQPFRTTDIWLV